jgi:hypothetical protein
MCSSCGEAEVGAKIDLSILRPGDYIEWESFLRRKTTGPNAGKLRSNTVIRKGNVVAVNKPAGAKYQHAWEMEWAPGYRCEHGPPGSLKVSVYTPHEPTVEHVNPKASFCSWTERKAGVIVLRDDGKYSSAQPYTVRAVWRLGKQVWRREDV